MPMEWIGHTCSSCAYAEDPYCRGAGQSTWCNKYKDEYGAQIILRGLEMTTHVCDAWKPRSKNCIERMHDYYKESQHYGYEPVYCSYKNGIIYGHYKPEDVSRLYKEWEADHSAAPDLIGICQSAAPLPKVSGGDMPVYTAFDNTDGHMWMEDFFNPDLAVEWLTGDYTDVDDLHIADSIYVKEKLQGVDE